MAKHKDLSDTELHQPKGANSASDRQTICADGVGGTSFKWPIYHGYWDYNDTATAGTPISLAVANTFYKLTNDGLGAFSQSTYKPPGMTDIWDTTTNQFDFTELELGDTVDIRLDIVATIGSPNTLVQLNMDLGIGGTPYSLPMETRLVKSSGTFQFTRWFSIYIGDSNTKDNPGEISVASDNAGDSVVVNGWYVRVNKRRPLFESV